jgi:hypothetical protein
MPDEHARNVDERVSVAGREAADGVAQLTKSTAHGWAA